MQKIYVLLRNDKQTGPYSLEEIIQFDLKPYDLIWIEGKSAGWYYPQEIVALHPYLNFLPKQATPVIEKKVETKKVFVAMPAAAKTEEPFLLKKVETPIKSFEEPLATQVMKTPTPVIAESYKSFEPVSKNIEEAVYAQFKNPVEEKTPYTNSTPTKTKKKSTVSIGGSIAAVLIVGGVLLASWVMNKRPAQDEATPEAYNNSPVQAEVTDTAVAKNENTKNTKQFSATKQKVQKNNLASKQKTVVVKHDVIQQDAPRVAANKPIDEPTTQNTTPPAKDEEQVTTKEETSTAPPETTSAQPEKKKKLRDKIFDIFKKKPAEQKTEETRPTETEAGERRATRREDGASLAQMVSIRFDVPNDWMMGIKGAKAILFNRSNEKISKAVVEVLYYDDDNNLLQKKTVNFSKVGAKDSQTISIPDHSSATRVDYNIVSVTGDPAA